MKTLDWKNGLYSFVWEEIPFVIAGDIVLFNIVKKIRDGFANDYIVEYLKQEIEVDDKEIVSYVNQVRDAINFADGYKSEIIEKVPNSQSMFTLNLTRNCNLNCKHCYAGGSISKNEMSEDDIDTIIDFMADRMISPRLMIITGGEPTLEKNKLKRAVLRGKLHNFKIRVNSNGLLIDDDLAKFFSINDVMVQLSMDGIDSATHALLRNSIDSFYKVLEAIKVLQRNNVQIALSFTVHSKNVEQLPQMLDYAIKNNIEKFNTSSLVQIGNAKLNDLETVEYVDEFKILYEAVKDDKAKQHLTRATLFAETVIAIRTGIKFTQCGTGNCTACVDATGDIFPCLNMMTSEYCIANVRNGNLKKQYQHNEILRQFADINIDTLNEICSKCFFKYWCGGFCRGETIANGGNIYDPYIRCKSWKKGLMFILKCLAESPDLYEEEALYE